MFSIPSPPALSITLVIEVDLGINKKKREKERFTPKSIACASEQMGKPSITRGRKQNQVWNGDNEFRVGPGRVRGVWTHPNGNV